MKPAPYSNTQKGGLASGTVLSTALVPVALVLAARAFGGTRSKGKGKRKKRRPQIWEGHSEESALATGRQGVTNLKA